MKNFVLLALWLVNAVMCSRLWFDDALMRGWWIGALSTTILVAITIQHSLGDHHGR